VKSFVNDLPNVRVGQPSEELRKRLAPDIKESILKLWVGSVDAIVFLENEVILVEVFIRNQFGKVEQLLYYEWLFKKDPAFKEHWNKRIRKMLVTPIKNPWYEEFARQFGIEVVYYTPDWIKPYIATLRPRERTGHRAGFPRLK